MPHGVHRRSGSKSYHSSDHSTSLRGRCQAIIWTSGVILLIGPLGTNVSEILMEIYTFWFRNTHLKMSYGKWLPFFHGLDVLKYPYFSFIIISLLAWSPRTVLITGIKTSRLRRNGWHFPDDILKWIFLNWNIRISIEISLNFVPRGLNDNIPPLVQVMAWRQLGDWQLSELRMVRSLTHLHMSLRLNELIGTHMSPRGIQSETGPLPWASAHWLVQCTLECHWNATGWPSVHWDTTGPPSEYVQGTLEYHWKNLVETDPHWNATG